jgi:hypothetical protein
MDKNLKDNLKLLATVVLGTVLILIAVILVVQLLWNNVAVVAIPVLSPITFWQSAGLYLLVNLFTVSSRRIKDL